MTDILSYISEEELGNEFYRNVCNRYVDQKFLYMDKISADTYYKTSSKHRRKPKDYDYYDVFKRILKKKTRTAIISLGCGSSEIEKEPLARLLKEGYDIVYIGVDTSEEMLEMAEKNLTDLKKLHKIFLRMDMTNDAFKETIAAVTKGCEQRIFAFIGGTLGNVNQTNIADSMYNALEKGEMLWVDVRIRPDMAMETNMKFFNRYAEFLSDGTEKMWFHPLKKIRVPYDSGKMNSRMIHEESVGALLFVFYFTFNQKVVVNMNGNRIHFLPNEAVQLQSIRVYHPETLVKFFKEHEFKLIRKTIKNGRGQFIFKK